MTDDSPQLSPGLNLPMFTILLSEAFRDDTEGLLKALRDLLVSQYPHLYNIDLEEPLLEAVVSLFYNGEVPPPSPQERIPLALVDGSRMYLSEMIYQLREFFSDRFGRDFLVKTAIQSIEKLSATHYVIGTTHLDEARAIIRKFGIGNCVLLADNNEYAPLPQNTYHPQSFEEAISFLNHMYGGKDE